MDRAPGRALRIHGAWNALESFDLPDGPPLYPSTDGRAWVDVDGDMLPDLLER